MGLQRIIQTVRTELEPPTVALEEEHVYRILSSKRRRLALSVLNGRADDVIQVADLSRAIAAEEIRTLPEEVPSTAYDAACVSLHHSHLPVLADLDVVSWDRDASTVRARASVSGLVGIIEVIERRTR